MKRSIFKLLATVLCLAICFGFSVACENKVEESYVSSDFMTETDEPSSVESVESEEASNDTSSEESSSEPASGEPSSTQSSSQEKSSNTESQVSKEPETVTAAPVVEKALGKETAEYLLSLDKSRRGWGQGVNYDAQNRPTACISSQDKYGKYDAFYIRTPENKVYLTFDEGYEYQNNTVSILNTLKEKNVKAVFFITLSYAKKNPDLVKRMINEGHIVGNHSSTHPDYTTVSLDKAYNDTINLHNYVKENFGYEMTLFRFPTGAHSEQMLALLQKLGYKSIFWSYAYRDWETANQPDKQESLKKLTERLHPGALYLLHAVSDTNTAILADFIDNIRAAGYDISNDY